MTDKQIIIDGVDVSGCNHFDMNFKHCDILGRLCREHNICYYKQLKRKEQECEELREALNEGCLHNLTLMTEQRVLLQTLTEIKEIANKTLWTYPNLDDVTKYNMFDKILQKISECEGNDE